MSRRKTTPVRLVVFDCDGTLIDSQHMIVTAMTRAFRAQRLAPPPPATVCRMVGLSLSQGIVHLAPDASLETCVAITDAYRQAFARMRADGDDDEPLFPGARAALDTLTRAGWILGLATGKGRLGVENSLGTHGILARFATIQTADDAPGKPDPAMLLQAMAAVGAEPSGTVLVGDTTYDMEMAVRARVAAVGVAWGYHQADELGPAGACAVIRDFAELAPLVRRLVDGETVL